MSLERKRGGRGVALLLLVGVVGLLAIALQLRSSLGLVAVLSSAEPLWDTAAVTPKGSHGTSAPTENAELPSTNTTTTTTKGDPPPTPEWTHGRGFAACSITMDNHPLWPEWLAYHYTTLPLRRLIVGLDPKSQTSPSEVFERYTSRGYLNVTVWKNDTFVSDPADRAYLAMNTTSEDMAVMQFVRRQRAFLRACLRQLYTEQQPLPLPAAAVEDHPLATPPNASDTTATGEESGPSWVLLADTDEFVAPQLPRILGANLPVLGILRNASAFWAQELERDPEDRHAMWRESVARGCFVMSRRRFVHRPGDEDSPTTIANKRVLEDLFKGIGEEEELPYLSTAELYQHYDQHNFKVMVDLSKLAPDKAAKVFAAPRGVEVHIGIKELCVPMKQKAKRRPWKVHHMAEKNPLAQQWATRGFRAKEAERQLEAWNATALPYGTRWVEGLVGAVGAGVARELLRPVA